MSAPTRRLGPRLQRLQRGIAALEMAFILPFVLLLLPFPLLIGRGLWHYAVLQQAAYDAARYMSSAPALDMKNAVRAQYAVAIAREMVDITTAGLTTPPYPWDVFIVCDGAPCGSGWPLAQVSVRLSVAIQDDLFNAITWPLLGDSGWLLTADVTIPYANN